MSYAPISQAEARALKKRVKELEEQHRTLFGRFNTSGYPGFSAIHLWNRQLQTDGACFGRLQTSRRLGCALVVSVDDSGALNYYAVPKP
jgi:hypothetical protein